MVVIRINDFHSRNSLPPAWAPHVQHQQQVRQQQDPRRVERWSRCGVAYRTGFLFKGQRESVCQGAPEPGRVLLVMWVLEKSPYPFLWARVLAIQSRTPPFSFDDGALNPGLCRPDIQALLVQTTGSPKAKDLLKFVILLLRFQNLSLQKYIFPIHQTREVRRAT